MDVFDRISYTLQYGRFTAAAAYNSKKFVQHNGIKTTRVPKLTMKCCISFTIESEDKNAEFLMTYFRFHTYYIYI